MTEQERKELQDLREFKNMIVNAQKFSVLVVQDENKKDRLVTFGTLINREGKTSEKGSRTFAFGSFKSKFKDSKGKVLDGVLFSTTVRLNYSTEAKANQIF